MNKGQWFRLTALPGQVFKVHHIYKDYIIAYGGDKNPKGRRQFVSFPKDANFIKALAPFNSKSEKALQFKDVD